MNSQVLMVPVRPAPFWKTSTDARSLLEEPHHLILSFEGVQARITDCMCPSCREHAKSALDLALAVPEKVVDLLQRHGVWEVGLVPHQILTLPGPNGLTESMRRIQEFADELRRHGCLAHVVKPINSAPGTWVRVKETIWISSEHILVPGMLGEIQVHPEVVSTPNISLYAKMAGRDQPYLYFTQHLEETSQPQPAEISKARELTERALAIYEEVHGYSGYLQIGQDKPRTEAEVRLVLINALEAAEQPNSRAQQAAAKSRIKTILKAFSQHPQAHQAATLLANIEHGVAWDELARSIYEFASRQQG